MSYAQTTTLMKLVDASDSPLILMPGGTRSGKTIATLMYLTTISERTNNNLIGITTDTAPALRDGAFRDFHNQVYGPPVQRIEQTNIPAPIPLLDLDEIKAKARALRGKHAASTPHRNPSRCTNGSSLTLS